MFTLNKSWVTLLMIFWYLKSLSSCGRITAYSRFKATFVTLALLRISSLLILFVWMPGHYHQNQLYMHSLGLCSLIQYVKLISYCGPCSHVTFTTQHFKLRSSNKSSLIIFIKNVLNWICFSFGCEIVFTSCVLFHY